MSFTEELKSWMFPASLETADPPHIGSRAPSSEKLSLPSPDAKPAVITFLRHCGCPFAEKTLKTLREAASSHPDVAFIAVSHSNQSHTSKWLDSVGGAGDINVVVDDERKLYAAWGLGASSFLHVLSPSALSDVYKLGKQEGIWNKPTESGSRWQTSGSWAVDKDGVVQWGGAAKSASDIPDFVEAAKTVDKGTA